MRQQSLFPTRILSGGVVATLVLTALSVPSWGQEGPPRFLLTGNGPVGVVQSLAFTPDSGQLLSGGSDKFVSIWGLAREGEAKQLRPALSDRLFWEISRGGRGHIYALAVSPDGERVAVGGYGARDSGGDIQIYDLKTREWLKTLKTHKRTICSLQFSPDSKRLVSVSTDGQTELWSVADWSSTTIEPAGAVLIDRRPILFLSNQVVVLSAPEANAERWNLGLYDLRTKRTQKLKQLHSGRVQALAKDWASGGWASSDRAGNLFYWNRATATQPVLVRQGNSAAAIDFDRQSHLFATTLQDKNGVSHLEMWSPQTKTLLDTLPIVSGDHAFACAVSPSGELLAAPTDDGSISLYPLRDQQGRLIPKPLSQGVPVPIASTTGKMYRVAFEAGAGYRLTMSSSPPTDTWFPNEKDVLRAFDLSKAEAIDPGQVQEGWRSAVEDGAGWTAKRSADKYQVVVSKGATKATIQLDPAYQGLAACYAWIVDNAGQPIAIAIGTTQQYGVFVYALPQNGRCRLIRYFRDHYGDVTSLSCSSDGRFLASASVDGTVKIWSLGGLMAPGREFRPEASWGAVFRKKGNDRLVVASADPAGIVARRNIQAGDEIIRVIYERNGQAAQATTADAMLSALEDSSIWQSVVLSILKQGGGDTERILMVPAWEPIVSLVINRQNEWVLWTPQGFYDASAAGDELVGWIMNGTSNRPVAKFFQADRFRNQLEKPDVIKNLLAARSLPSAFQAAKQEIPKQLQDGISDVAQRLPRVKILDPLPEQKIIAGEKIITHASFEFPNREDMDDFDMSLYVNGIPVKNPEKKVQGNVAYMKWETPPPNERNVLRVVASQETNDKLGDYSDARIAVHAETKPEPANLFFLGIAANDYPGERRLDFCRADVTSVMQSLRAASSRYFQMPAQNVILTTDKEITRRSISQLPDKLLSQVGKINPRDVVIVYLAGHGAAASSFGETPEYHFIPVDAKVQADSEEIRAEGIPWSTIQKIADLPCRKIFMIDTCFQLDASVQITAKDISSTAESLKYAVRPLRRRETMVITGCGLGQYSWQDGDIGHGFFTKAVLDGLEGFADGFGESPNRDRTIELRELTNFVIRQVPEMAENAQTSIPQVPTVSNTELGYLPLVTY